MKKISLMVIGAFFIMLFACTSQNKGTYEEISFETYAQMRKEDQTFMMLISAADCSHCIEYKEKVLDPYLKDHDIVVYELNFTKQEDEALSRSQILREFPDFLGTPTTYFIEDGNVGSVQVGGMSTDQLNELVQKYKLESTTK